MTRDFLDPRIGEANRVEHAAAKLRDAQRRVAAARFGSDCLRHDAAQGVEVDDAVELAPKTGGTGG